MVLPTIDNHLIVKAEAKAGSADIHDVKQWIGLYRCAFKRIAEKEKHYHLVGNCEETRLEWALRIESKYVKMLQSYVAGMSKKTIYESIGITGE